MFHQHLLYTDQYDEALESTKTLHCKQIIPFQIVWIICSSSLTLVGFTFFNFLSIKSHRFSMGLRSCDTASHLITLIPLFSNHLSAHLDRCGGALSCLNIQLYFDESNVFLINNGNASSITLTHAPPLSLPEYMINEPLALPAIEPDTLTQPPPPCIFGTKLKGWSYSDRRRRTNVQFFPVEHFEVCLVPPNDVVPFMTPVLMFTSKQKPLFLVGRCF